MPGDADDVAGVGFLDFDALEALEREQLREPVADLDVVAVCAASRSAR